MSESKPHPPFKHCLVGVDGSELSCKAFHTACDLIANGSVTVSVVAVVHSPLIVMSEGLEREALIEHETSRLQAVLHHITQQASLPNALIETKVLTGEPVRTLLDYANAHRVDHIVIGHRSTQSITQWLLGSVAKGVIDGAKCTVTITR